MKKSIASIVVIAGLQSLFFGQAFAQESCQNVYRTGLKAADIYQDYRADVVRSNKILKNAEEDLTVRYAFGTNVPIARSFEKEGLFYEEIMQWFPKLRPEGAQKLRERLTDEISGKRDDAALTTILMSLKRLVGLKAPGFQSMDAQARLNLILSQPDPFAVLPMKHKSLLFETSVLKFDYVMENSATPKNITVGDDDGSYEVRSNTGITYQGEFFQQRKLTEDYLEGKVGHQHLFHAWPNDLKKREAMAPQYIELLDSSTWYLFWRQAKRNNEDVDSIVSHPYLGVYTRDSLNRLYNVVVDNNPKAFRDKFRMVGARSFKSRDEIPGQLDHGEYSPDWELRSGNKGAGRDFIEGILISRLQTGDYSGVKDFRSYKFDPSAAIGTLTRDFLKDDEIAILEQFQRQYRMMKWKQHTLATNHVRNKVVSPLLPWAERLPIAHKEELLKRAQNQYAHTLVKIAKEHLRDFAKAKNTTEKGEVNAETLEKLEEAVFIFSDQVRLDRDFERYLNPRPDILPNIYVQPKGAFDVNKMISGLEYSFRFPLELKPESLRSADRQIKNLAEKISTAFGGTDFQLATGDSHGHNIAVKYTFLDAQGQKWRVEWDGIQRSYRNGKAYRAWGGHVEIPTPAMTPTEIAKKMPQLYRIARENGLEPNRRMGGGHFNFDLRELKKMPVEQGTKAITNLITYFESNETMILSLWTHPARFRAAEPVRTSTEFLRKLQSFEGNWQDLGRLLYEGRYFNTFVGRKPKYIPLNLTALMTDVVPQEYLNRTLDIKNKSQKWFPNFGKVEGRGEARFFDAPKDEYMATLQAKYWLALLNHTFNEQGRFAPQRKYSYEDVQKWVEDPVHFFKDAEKHLLELGLNPSEFQPLMWDSYVNLVQGMDRSFGDYENYNNFLPAR